MRLCPMTDNLDISKDKNVKPIQINTTKTVIGSAQAPIFTGVINGPVNLGDKKIYQQQKTEFYEPSLDLYKPDKYIRPKVSVQLIELIRKNRLLVLGGSIEVDKSSLARHIAWCLSEELKHALVVPKNKKIPVLEWYRSSSDPQRIGAKLQETKETSIFILPQVSPQDIRYNLSFIHKSAEDNKHFVLITTDIPFPTWKLSDVERSLFCQELSPENLYGPNDLAKMLVQGLNDHNLSLPMEFSVDSVAEQLKTPENISLFIQLLCAEKKSLKPENVTELIKLAQDKHRTLGAWYHTVLSSRERLLPDLPILRHTSEEPPRFRAAS